VFHPEHSVTVLDELDDEAEGAAAAANEVLGSLAGAPGLRWPAVRTALVVLPLIGNARHDHALASGYRGTQTGVPQLATDRVQHADDLPRLRRVVRQVACPVRPA
jgi:hypothetical protein